MEYTIEELSKTLGLKMSGDRNTTINHVCGMDNLKPGGLGYITNPTELANLPTPKGVFDARRINLDDIDIPDNTAIIVPPDIKSQRYSLIFSNDPLAHHVQATELLHDFPGKTGQIHPDAFIGKNVIIGNGVTIDPKVVVYDNVKIGDHTTIRSGVVVMNNSKIGDNCVIFPNVTIRENCQIGNRVILHPGVVIGADGYGFFQRDKKNIKIPQVGIVVIEDDVEIGACTTIDRARFDKTIIRKGCKLDNLIHIAHNVELGEHSLITAQSGIAGSVKTGHHLMMGGQSGIADNLTIGNHVTMLARTLITSKTEDQSAVAGMPSRPIKAWRQIQALINSLDGLFERMKRLEQSFKDFSSN